MKKKRSFKSCLWMLLPPLLLCGLCNSITAVYVALTETPFDDEAVDAYALLPEKTTGAAMLTNLDLREDARLDTVFPYFSTHAMIDPIFTLANLQPEVVSQVGLISVDYNSAGLLIYTPQAKTAFDYIHTQTDIRSEDYDGNDLYIFTSPYAEGYGEKASSKNLEPWAWALLNDDLLITGGESTVKNILDIYYERRPNLFEARPVMRNLVTLLRDYPNTYYQFRRAEDIVASKVFAKIVQIVLIPVAWIGEFTKIQATGYAAGDVEGGCTAIVAFQMPSRKSAIAINSFFGSIGVFENFSRPNNLSWNADSIENSRINNVYYTQIFWGAERCEEMQSESPPYVFPP